MLAQNTHWSSGEFRGTPSSVTLIREPPAPRIRMAVVPVPSPLSLHARIPGVCEKRRGSSRPVFEKASSCCFFMFVTAYGAFFCARTPFTTTSCNCSTCVESYKAALFWAFTLMAPSSAVIPKNNLFIPLLTFYFFHLCKGGFVLIKPTIHPYAGMIRIRLEGIISAHTRGHPLIISEYPYGPPRHSRHSRRASRTR